MSSSCFLQEKNKKERERSKKKLLCIDWVLYKKVNHQIKRKKTAFVEKMKNILRIFSLAF
jgi:hypothetical protein